MEKTFINRIKYKGNLKLLSKKIASDFILGDYRSHRIILVGYEDINFLLTTSKGKFFVKVFSTQRTLSDAQRIVDIMLQTTKKGISVPKIFQSNQGYLHIIKDRGSILRMCVMDLVTGKDFFSSRQKLTKKDVQFIAHQASLINRLKIKPTKIYDSWAITNFLPEFKKKHAYLDKQDSQLIKPLVTVFKELKVSQLPHCFAHGDIIKTNVIKDKDGKLWLVDFSVANQYPRIQELAVLACDVLFDSKSQKNSDEMLKWALDEYQKTITLTSQEKKSLPAYIKLAHAMHVLCASYEKKYNKNNTRENEYFLSTGKVGLRSSH